MEYNNLSISGKIEEDEKINNSIISYKKKDEAINITVIKEEEFGKINKIY